MAYFECTIGGASGDGVALIIECDPSFAGSVITADNGEDVFTDTCPSVAPYTVRFDGIPTGTYTISGVSGGTTITKQFTVLDYTTSLRPIPVGATVTPVNDIQIWLHCADIWDKNYVSLGEVLADASTLQALIASNNAADYMARSTTWASDVCSDANAMTYIGANDYCADALLADDTWCNAICNSAYFESVLNVKVPTMTSNTAPSGVCSADTYYGSGYEAYKAFNNGDGYWWVNSATYTGHWIQYQFTSKVKVRKLVSSSSAGYTSGQSWELRGSNDGSTFTRVASYTTANTAINFSFVNNTAYKYYRWYCVSGTSSSSLTVSSLQFYGRA